MDSTFVFTPSRLIGLLFHSAVILILGGGSGLAIVQAVNQQVGTYFVLFLLLAVFLFAPIPFLIYRGYALIRASYKLDRDGLHLRWGLRAEDIPLVDVAWVRWAANLPVRLPLPRPSWPGSLRGTANTDELGAIEYMASDQRNLLLVATSGRVFAISPQDPQAFLDAFKSAFEMGSLSPIPASSVLPAVYLTQVWSDRAARVVLAAGFVLAGLLFVLVSLLIPVRSSTSLGFYPGGAPLPGVPSIQLLLLPVLSVFFYLVDFLVGLFFFRWKPYRPLAFLVWGSSLLTTLLLVIATVLILL